MIRSTLKPCFESSEKMFDVFAKLGIKETARAEELLPQDFANITNEL